MSNKISLNGAMTVEDLIAHLTGLTEGLKAGRILVERGSDFIVLFVADKVDFKMETKVKPDKAKLSLTLSWPLVSSECTETALRISDGTTFREPPHEPCAAARKC